MPNDLVHNSEGETSDKYQERNEGGQDPSFGSYGSYSHAHTGDASGEQPGPKNWSEMLHEYDPYVDGQDWPTFHKYCGFFRDTSRKPTYGAGTIAKSVISAGRAWVASKGSYRYDFEAGELLEYAEMQKETEPSMETMKEIQTRHRPYAGA